jgi:hypothetical protein
LTGLSLYEERRLVDGGDVTLIRQKLSYNKMKESSIQIIEKPEWVSWDEIHEVVWEAHANNREKGIIMSYPSLSGEEIKNMIGDHGKMFLAVGGLFLFGIYGLLWGTVIHSAICTLINMWLVSKHIGYKTLSQLKDILPIMTVTIFAYIISSIIADMMDLGLYTDGLLKLVIFCAIYIGWSLIFKPASFTYISEIVISKIKPKKR